MEKKKQNLVIEEYIKDVMVIFGGNGGVMNSIQASCKNPQGTSITHTFGNDESINEFIKLGSISEANARNMHRERPLKNNCYTFAIGCNGTHAKIPVVKELKTNGTFKKFKIPWQMSFGNVKTASYYWTWLSPLMFSTLDEDGTQHSLFKVMYPTRQFVMRMFFQPFYPLEESPMLVMNDVSGKQHEIGRMTKVDFYKEKTMYNLERNLPFECYKIVIKNPVVGNTYKATWKMELDRIARFMCWLEASH